MKFSEALAHHLKSKGFKTVHCVTGGAVVHLIDSFENLGFKCIYYQHEQSAGFGAVAESKITNKPSICVVTTGPGGTNAITPLLSAWQDSVPILFISGQSRLEHWSRNTGVRQLGTQEFDISNFVIPITKKALTLTEPCKLVPTVDFLIENSLNCRPGPVWLDIPLDFQWNQLKYRPETTQRSISSSALNAENSQPENNELKANINSYLEKFIKSPRPAVIIGGGVRSLSKTKLISHLEANKIPYLVTYNSISNSQSSDKIFNFGIPGIAGNRCANSIVFNCSDLLCIGTHLPVPITGANHRIWSENSTKCIVNVDSNEIYSHRVNFDYKFSCTAELFLDILTLNSHYINSEWMSYLESLRSFQEPRIQSDSKYIDIYTFIESISQISSNETSIVVDGGGTINSAFFSSFCPKSSTSVVMSSGVCAMGSGIPELIGAWSASKYQENIQKRFILLVGDGSLAFNVQDLSTLVSQGIPAHIFVIANNGYSSIRNTQEQFLDGRHHGVSPSSGVSLPTIKSYAHSYRLEYNCLHNGAVTGLTKQIYSIITSTHPSINEVQVDPNQKISPIQGFRLQPNGSYSPSPLYQMNPELSSDYEAIFSQFLSAKND